MKRLGLQRVPVSFGALCLGVLAWAAGCATPRPLVDPYFAARSYTPARITVMPPDVFVIYDELGDNDPRKSADLSREVGEHMGRLLTQGLRARGYDVDTSARWDGVHAPDGSILVSGQELGWMANSILQYSASPAGGGEGGTMASPVFVAPDLARRVGGAAQADALFYANIKGVAVSPGKRTAQVLGVVFFVVVLAAIVLLMISQSKGGGGGRAPGVGTGGGGGGTVRSAGGGVPASNIAPAAGAPTMARAVPRGYGSAPYGGGGRTYGGSNVSVGLGMAFVVPLEGPQHTHEGAVRDDDDDTFDGDEAYVSMTLVSAYDGRVLWQLRDSVDVELDNPADVQRFVDRILATVPPSLKGQPAPTP